MNVSLTPTLEAMVRAKVETGMYNNASEVIREALRIMEREERKQVLIDAVREGIEQLERGEGIVFDETTMKRLRERAVAQRLAGHRVNDLVKPQAGTFT